MRPFWLSGVWAGFGPALGLVLGLAALAAGYTGSACGHHAYDGDDEGHYSEGSTASVGTGSVKNTP